VKRAQQAADVHGANLVFIDVGPERFAIVTYTWNPQPTRLHGLTSAECNVLQGLLKGLSNPQIAAIRKSAVRTVANQVAKIFAKLGVRSRAELLATVHTTSREAAGSSR
jgi:DNA-binding NarL/FixJ family response regulator